jgi:hypothetical protein
MMRLFRNGYTNTDGLRIDYNTYCARYGWQSPVRRQRRRAPAARGHEPEGHQREHGQRERGRGAGRRTPTRIRYGPTRHRRSCRPWPATCRLHPPRGGPLRGRRQRRPLRLAPGAIRRRHARGAVAGEAGRGTRADVDLAEAAAAWDVDANVVTVGRSRSSARIATRAVGARAAAHVHVKVVTETYWPDTITTAHFYCKPTQETLDLYPSAAVTHRRCHDRRRWHG